MAIREILKMGDARLLRVAPPVTAFDKCKAHKYQRAADRVQGLFAFRDQEPRQAIVRRLSGAVSIRPM